MEGWGMDQPWLSEPDRDDFEAHGLPCAIRRHGSLLHLCGYVGVPEGHPLFGISYSTAAPVFVERLIDSALPEPERIAQAIAIASDQWSNKISPESMLDAHGGITYSDAGNGKYLPKGFYWFGFDCAHSGDLTPGSSGSIGRGGAYRDIEYVREQCRALAEQLAGIKAEGAAS